MSELDPGRKVIYSLSVSLDGYVNGPNQEIDWNLVDQESFEFINRQQEEIDTFLFGRGMYETMKVWDTIADEQELPEHMQAFARMWNEKLKIVFSRTLESVQGNARLAKRSLADEIAHLKSSPGGSIEVAGPTLAASAIEQGLIDEYSVYVNPVVLGGGTPFFGNVDRRFNLQLTDTRTFESGVIYLSYRPVE